MTDSSDRIELPAELAELSAKATPGPWHHVNAFKSVPATRTIHGKVPAEHVDYVSTWPHLGTPNGHRVVINMLGRESGVGSDDMAFIVAATNYARQQIAVATQRPAQDEAGQSSRISCELAGGQADQSVRNAYTLAEGQPVTLTYTNWRGETAERTITPTGRVLFASNEWHPEPQWLVEAHDARSDEVRMFALKGFGAAGQGVSGPGAGMSRYDDIFNAIAAATTRNPTSIGISVKAFLEALKSHAVVPLAVAPTPPAIPSGSNPILAWPEDAVQAFWKLKALHEARMRLIDMVVRQERARNGEGKAWNGTFYAEQLALLSKKDLEPCMACGGTGCEVDPETGPAACEHCSGDGVFVPFSEKA